MLVESYGFVLLFKWVVLSSSWLSFNLSFSEALVLMRDIMLMQRSSSSEAVDLDWVTGTVQSSSLNAPLQNTLLSKAQPPASAKLYHCAELERTENIPPSHRQSVFLLLLKMLQFTLCCCCCVISTWTEIQRESCRMTFEGLFGIDGWMFFLPQILFFNPLHLMILYSESSNELDFYIPI